MSKGAIIIANDTEQIEYVRLARISARLITKNLALPVALVTDRAVDYPEFEKVIVVDRKNNNRRSTNMNSESQTLDWYNLNRTDIYDLTPWDRTLLVDADMLILTDALASHMNANFDFAIASDIHNPKEGITLTDTLTSNKPIDLLWATAIIFNKSPEANTIFQMAKHIIKHYNTYSKIYDFPASPIRNDFAFSIAIHLMGGYGMKKMNLKNYALTTVNFTDTIHKIKDNGKFVIAYQKNSKTYLQQLGLNDIHFLNKLDLMQHINQLEML